MHGYFKNFGDIKSIVMLEGKKPGAFVTFKREISAFTAISYEKNRELQQLECKYILQPVNTLQQTLNDDCWEKVFQYLDVRSLKRLREVSKKFNSLVIERGFKFIKSFEFDKHIVVVETHHLNK